MKKAKIEELRDIMLKALYAHADMVVSDYDRGFHNGLAHAIYLLDEVCRSEQKEEADDS